MYGTGASKGQWNDLPCSNTVGAYVIEYGGTAGESVTVRGKTTLKINSTEAFAPERLPTIILPIRL